MMQTSKRYMSEVKKSDQYALKVSVNERYQLQTQLSETVVQNLVYGIIRDIDSMNDFIRIGMGENQNERQRKRVRRKKGKDTKWIWRGHLWWIWNWI